MEDKKGEEKGRVMRPYEKYRVGNYKIQLVRLQINDKGEARVLNKNAHFKKSFLEREGWEEIRALIVCNLEETWSVRIPEHYGMYSIIIDLWRSGDETGETAISVMLGNMLNATCVADAFYQNLLVLSWHGLVAHHDEVSSWEEKRKKYDKLLEQMKWCLDADLETYKARKREDLSADDYRRDEFADKAREELKK